jgi:hypothetical protein
MRPLVIPAKAGTQATRMRGASLGSRFRGNDDKSDTSDKSGRR